MKIILLIIIALDLISKIPQIYKLYNFKNADSISVLSYIFWNLSSILYIIYCISIHEIPLLLETCLNLSLNTTILFMSFYYNKKIHGNWGLKYELKKLFRGKIKNRNNFCMNCKYFIRDNDQMPYGSCEQHPNSYNYSFDRICNKFNKK